MSFSDPACRTVTRGEKNPARLKVQRPSPHSPVASDPQPFSNWMLPITAWSAAS